MKIVKVRAIAVVSTCLKVAILDDKDTSKVKGIVKIGSRIAMSKHKVDIEAEVKKKICKRLKIKGPIKLRYFKDKKSKVLPALNKKMDGSLIAVFNLFPKYTSYFTPEAIEFFGKAKKATQSCMEVRGKLIPCTFLGKQTSESKFKVDLKRFANMISGLISEGQVLAILADPCAMQTVNMKGTGEPQFILLCYLFLDPDMDNKGIIKKYEFESGRCPK